MRYTLAFLLAFGVISSFSGNVSAENVAAAETTHAYKIIHAEQLKVLVDLKIPLTLLDARTKPYDDGYRLPGALFHAL